MSSYKTFDNKVLNVDDLSHQHLSNICWYHQVIYGLHPPAGIMDILRKKYDGKILDYHPNPKFINEISYLERKNLLVWRYGLNMGEMGRAYIIYKGNKIGEFLSIEYQRNMIIDKICEK